MKDQMRTMAPPLVTMALAAAAGKMYTFWRIAAEVRDVLEYDSLGANVISNSTPVAVTFDQVLSSEEAAHIISLARPHMQRSHVLEQPQWLPGIAAPSGAVRKAQTSGRTNTVAWVKHNETPVVQDVVGRISDIVGISSTYAEALHVVQYTDGQECKRSLHHNPC